VNHSEKQELNPAEAYWNQRMSLSGCRERIVDLCNAVDRPTDLFPYQWAQLMAFAMEFSPDIILELGRGKGNSTCAFTEVANQMKPKSCKVLSYCLTDDWDRETLPRVRKVVPASWFEPLETLQTDILTVDFKKILNGFTRVLVFWDAHGFSVAECVLGKILPLTADRPHAVIMHDLTDTRYLAEESNLYDGQVLWKGNIWEGPRLRIGNIEASVEQLVAILDFTTRNNLHLHSADHRFHTELGNNPEMLAELKHVIGEELFSLNGYWFWFSLNEIPGPYTFPKFSPPVRSNVKPVFLQRLKRALYILLGHDGYASL
jgi:hypothetical protein